MSYTWTTGEVITAEKLNATQGGVTIVTISINFDEETGDETYTADKTYAELSNIIENGGYVVAHDEGNQMYLNLHQYFPVEAGMIGSVVFNSVHSGANGVELHSISIRSNGEISTLDEKEPGK